tara:strand:- start:1102 stop:2892 length:1791 start_codon:yes stop_codon:yes gene_type:complete
MIIFKNLNLFGLNKFKILLFVIVALSASLIEGIGIASFLPLIDYINIENDSSLEEQNNYWIYINQLSNFFNIEITLKIILFFIFSVFLIRSIFIYLLQIYSSWLYENILHKARLNAYNSYVNADYSFYSKYSTGNSINILTTEIVRAGGYFKSIFILISTIILFLIYVILLFSISLKMSVAAVFVLLLASLIIKIITKNIRILGKKVSFANNALSELLIDRIKVFRLIKLTLQQRQSSNLISDKSKNVLINNYNVQKNAARIELFLEPLIIMFVLILVFLSINYFSISLSKLGIFLIATIRLLPLSKNILKHWNSALSSLAAFEKVIDYINNLKSHSEKNVKQLIKSDYDENIKNITFNNINFAHKNQKENTLSNINLKFETNQISALVGSSGSGKTTLLDLIPKLLIPNKGEILFNNQNISNISTNIIRKKIAYVSQDSIMLNDTIYNNLIFGSDKIDDELIKGVLIDTDSIDFVNSLPNQINTIIGEGGRQLSGGQIQRLSLARALLNNPNIIILDEPTSSLDSESEHLIKTTLYKKIKNDNRIIIIVAHRLSTVLGADQIVVLNNGQISNIGSHDMLIKEDKWYSDAIKYQTL